MRSKAKHTDRHQGRRRKECGKMCYPSKREADRAVAIVLASGRDSPGKVGRLESYYCKGCKSHHMGHGKFRV